MSTAEHWQEWFTQPQLFATRVAPAHRTAGLVTVVDQRGPRLHAWDVASAVLRPVATPPANVLLGCWLGHDGRYAYVLADHQGDELGHLTAVDLRDEAPPVDLTPALERYAVRGVGISRDGAGLVLDAVRDDGYHIYYLAAPAAADPPLRLLAHYRHEAWQPLLSADGTIATVNTTEHNPGVRRFAVRALRVADGEPLELCSDGPESSVEARLFSPVPGDPTVVATSDRSGVRRPLRWRIGDGAGRPLAIGDDLPGDVVPLDWSDDGRYLLLCHTWRAAQLLLRYDLAADRMEPLDVPAGSYYDVVFRSSHFGPHGSVLAATETLATPLTVYRHEPGGRTEPVLASEPVPSGVAARSVDIRSSDGTLVQGWLVRPDRPGPHPTLIYVHGGPHHLQLDAYDPRAQAMVAHGFAYLGLNYRGSISFGKAYQEGIWGEIGRWEVEDIAAAHRWLVETGVAAPDRVLLAGGSYGGFLTLFALSVRPELWAGGIAEVAIADWRLAYEDANPANRTAFASWFGGSPDQVPQRYRASSPMTHLAKLAAPVLIRQGQHDSRTPARQMVEYERAAQRLGKPVTVLWNEGGHAPPDDPLAYERRVLEFATGCVAPRR